MYRFGKMLLVNHITQIKDVLSYLMSGNHNVNVFPKNFIILIRSTDMLSYGMLNIQVI